MLGRLPGPATASKLERRARAISDPVERLRYLRQATAAQPPLPWTVKIPWRWLAPAAVVTLSFTLAFGDAVRSRWKPSLPAVLPQPQSQARSAPNVWPVEHTDAYDVYSNGLRIENSLAVANTPRSYRLFRLGSESDVGMRRDQPAGIVFHTTESDQAPFEPDQNRALKRIGRELLLYVRHKRAYHFVIDRFGRVHRMVVESDAANHAGHSVWADSQWLYLELNTSFLGVAFEARTPTDGEPINQAQVHAAAVLTDMLRSKYGLAAANCVTHAQVSINPGNKRIGWHTDWGTGFPFQAIGLPNNYATPTPGLYLLGFEYDPAYINSTNPDLWKGLALAEACLEKTAAGRRMTVAGYRKLLQQNYRDLAAALHRDAVEEDERK